jgi:hypothetical protein
VEQRERRGGRFFGRRVNCEQVPLLPAGAVNWMLDDPRKIPYLLVWKSERTGAVQEAVRLARHNEIKDLGGLDWTNAIEVKRHDRTRNFIRIVLRRMPRNGGSARLLICPYCNVPRRALYGWVPGGQYTHSARTSDRQCRACAGLRHESEGGALVHHGRGAFSQMIEATYGPIRSERTGPWYPWVFTSTDDPRLDELLRQNC